jgi:riboflavin synthase alpha subunit
VGLGDSIALNGACMTVTSLDANASRFTIDISAESLDKTAGLDRPAPVNLEKACARRTAWAATWSRATSTAWAAC